MSALVVCEVNAGIAPILQRIIAVRDHTNSDIHLIVACPALSAEQTLEQTLRQKLKEHALSASVICIEWLPAAELASRVHLLTQRHLFELVWW